MGYHFDKLYFVNGQIYAMDRYAIDSLEFNDALNSLTKGDPAVNTSYFNYGRTLYAAADGVVVETQDEHPENSGNAKDVTFNSFKDYPGNFVLLDIGGGRYAFYAHCIPKSLQVKVGDHVKKGDPIALLGNSGYSSAPHLHFQITDKPDYFATKGLPFVLKQYTKTGEIFLRTEASPRFLTPTSVTNSLMEETAVFSVE